MNDLTDTGKALAVIILVGAVVLTIAATLLPGLLPLSFVVFVGCILRAIHWNDNPPAPDPNLDPRLIELERHTWGDQ